jgi:hypothetical protein
MNKPFLSVVQWKSLFFAIVIFCAGLNVLAAFQWQRSAVAGKIGALPFVIGGPDQNYQRPILGLEPNNALAMAGAKIGDTITFDRFGDSRRVMEAGELVGLTWFSPQGGRHLTVTVEPASDVGHAPTAYFGSQLFYLGCLCFAVVIGFRLAELPAMRVLSIAFACNSLLLFDQLPAGAFQNFLTQTANPLLGFVGYGSFTYFSLTYPEGELRWRSTGVRRAFYVLSGLIGVFAMASVAENHGLWPSNWRAIVSPNKARYFVSCIGIVWSLASLALSWRRTSGVVKQRLAWVGVCVGTIYATYLIQVVNILLGFPLAPESIYEATLPTELIALATLAYALLRYRLFDFGFVVNRALVAAVISTFLLVIFAVTEWSVDKLLHFEGREKNVIFDAAVAMAIILCFHRIQHWVNHKVDHTFFRSWYDAAERLRRFLSKTSQITESSALLEKYAVALGDFTGLADISIYLARTDDSMTCAYTSPGSAAAELDANHDVLIELRHARRVIHLRPDGDGPHDELALPMMTQGRLRGFILVGPKPDRQQYRPDEMTLLGTAAQQLGMDFENLRVVELEQQIRRLSHVESSYITLEREAELLRRLVRAEAA